MQVPVTRVLHNRLHARELLFVLGASLVSVYDNDGSQATILASKD